MQRFAENTFPATSCLLQDEGFLIAGIQQERSYRAEVKCELLLAETLTLFSTTEKQTLFEQID